jgi:hypothetical protein
MAFSRLKDGFDSRTRYQTCLGTYVFGSSSCLNRFRNPHFEASGSLSGSEESLTLLNPMPKLAVLFYEDFGL